MPKDRELKEHLRRRLKALDDEYNEEKAYHKEIRDYLYPDGGYFYDEGDHPSKKVKRHAKIIDDTGTRANTVLGSGMQSGLTSPARPWLKLGMLDPDRDRDFKNRGWLNFATKAMLNLLQQTNFYSTIHSLYEEVGAFNTGVLLGERDPDEILNFDVKTAGEYRIASNQRFKRIDTLFMRDMMTAQGMIKEFGANYVSQAVKNAAEPGTRSNPFQLFQVVHAIEPREDLDPTKIDNLNMPWRSCWWEEKGSEDDVLLRHSGYRTRNFFVSRWKQAGRSYYGTGPGKQALGNIKMLQEMQKSKIIGLHKEIAPPMKAPIALKGRVNLMPDSVTWYTQKDPEGIGPLYQVQLNMQNMELGIAQVQNMIERTFMNDLFLLITERPQMTATEVAERHEEKLLLLGPTIERQIHDLLDPLVDFVFYVMVIEDMLPPPPPDLQGQPLKVEYISLLAQAQKLVTGKAIESTLGMMGVVAQLDPQARHVINYDETMREYAYITGFPPEALNDDDMVQQLRAGELAQQQRAAQLEQAGAEAQIAQQLGNTPTRDGTALDSLQNQLQGGVTGAA